MCSCTVRSQVLQKILKLCASLPVAKAPKLFSLSSKCRDPGFLLTMFFPLPSVESVESGEGGRQSLLIQDQFCSVVHLKKLRTDHRGKPSKTVKQTDGNKRLFWCEEEKSVASAPQANAAAGLTGGAYPSGRKVEFAIGADAQFIHCLSRIWGGG